MGRTWCARDVKVGQLAVGLLTTFGGCALTCEGLMHEGPRGRLFGPNIPWWTVPALMLGVIGMLIGPILLPGASHDRKKAKRPKQ